MGLGYPHVLKDRGPFRTWILKLIGLSYFINYNPFLSYSIFYPINSMMFVSNNILKFLKK